MTDTYLKLKKEACDAEADLKQFLNRNAWVEHYMLTLELIIYW